MKSPAAILVYGRDPALLETRRMVLASVGYDVTEAANLSQVKRTLSERPLDLLILCHSLSTDDCHHTLALATSRWPLMRILVLTAGASGCSTQLISEVLDAIKGPRELLSTVAKLVKTEPTANTHHYPRI